MASLEQRNGIYRIVFRCGGQKYSRSLRTRNKREAHAALAQLEDSLRRVELGVLALPENCDVPTVLLSSGASSQRTKITVVFLGELLDDYFQKHSHRCYRKQHAWDALHTHWSPEADNWQKIQGE